MTQLHPTLLPCWWSYRHTHFALANKASTTAASYPHCNGKQHTLIMYTHVDTDRRPSSKIPSKHASNTGQAQQKSRMFGNTPNTAWSPQPTLSFGICAFQPACASQLPRRKMASQ